MLVGQAFVALPAWGAVLYTLALLGGSSILLWLKGFTLSRIGMSYFSLSASLIFVVVFSVHKQIGQTLRRSKAAQTHHLSAR